MSWTIGGERIYVHAIKNKAKNIIARLNPIASGTILHRFGYDDDIYNIEATVVTTSTKNTIKGFAKSGSTYTLVGDEGTIGNFYVSSFDSDRYEQPYQKIRTDLPVTTPVYKIQLELYPE